ncbi:MAG: cysteine desulfurase family protein [Bacteroidia bacterium]
MIYLDYNATTPTDARVLEAMLPYFTQKFGNAASSSHAWGWTAAEAVAKAREQLAYLIGASEQELVFTSGATEAINLAIKGVAEVYAEKGKHIVTVQTEHKAVLDVCQRLEKQGYNLTYLPVNEGGLIDLEELEKAITPQTILVSVMYANNETGVLQPISEIAQLVHQKGSLFMSDGVQAVGKIPVKVEELGIDLLPMSGHKFYAPKGVGALYVRRRNPRVRLTALIDGGGHERGLRSGTLNVPAIVGMGAAAEIAQTEMYAEVKRLQMLRDKLENALLATGKIWLNGDKEKRLAHVANLQFSSLSSEMFLKKCRNLAVSTGSACTSALMQPSHVLRAMGLSEKAAYNSIRMSLGRFTTEAEIEKTIENILQVL